MTQETPLYCNMQAMNGAERERYNQLRERLESAIEQITEFAAGYAFRLRTGALSIVELAE